MVRFKSKSSCSYRLVYAGLVNGSPTLQPEQAPHLCPNETVNMTYTCWGSAIHSMEWIMEQYIPVNMPIKYVPAQLENDSETYPLDRSGIIFTKLIHITRISNTTGQADLNSSLTLITHEQLKNGTNITCKIERGQDISYSSTFLYYAGEIYIYSLYTCEANLHQKIYI